MYKYKEEPSRDRKNKRFVEAKHEFFEGSWRNNVPQWGRPRFQDQRYAHQPHRPPESPPRRGWPDQIHDKQVPRHYQYSEPPRREWSDQPQRRMVAKNEAKAILADIQQLKDDVSKGMKEWRSCFTTEMKKELVDMLKSQPKSPTKRPSIPKETHQERNCSKEEPAIQNPETHQPLLVCKGMNEISTSNQCANEILLSHEGNQPEEAQKEQPICHEPESIPKSLSHDLQKHCKELDMVRTKSNLFVLVSAQEETRFGLEKVKEFCVSGFVFDKMFQSFETLKHEEFSRQKDFLFDEVCNSNLALNFNLVRKMFGNELSRNLVFNEHFFKLELFTSLSRNVFNSALPKKVFECFSKFEQVFESFYDHKNMMHLFLPKESNAGFGAALKYQRRIHKGEEDQRFRPPDLDQEQHQNVLLLILIKQEPPDATNKPMPSLNQFRGKSYFLHDSATINLSFVHADSLDLRANPFEEGGDDVILPRPKMDAKEQGNFELGTDVLKDQTDNQEVGTDVPTNEQDGHTDGPATDPKEEPPDDLTDIRMKIQDDQPYSPTIDPGVDQMDDRTDNSADDLKLNTDDLDVLTIDPDPDPRTTTDVPSLVFGF